MSASPLRAIALVAVAACGRINFDQARVTGDASTDGLPADAPPLTSGLVAYYPMDVITPFAGGFAAEAQTLVDATGTLAPGTCPNFACVGTGAGVIGGAYLFSGAGVFVVPDAPALHLTSAFTIALWIQRTTEASAFAKAQASGAGGSFELALFAGDTWFCTDHDPGPMGEDCMMTAIPLDVVG